jgi:hypothetical protein
MPHEHPLFLGPSFEGFVFILKSESDKPAHKVTITSQTSIDVVLASIKGTWQGDGPSAKPFTGMIIHFPRGPYKVSITLTWVNGMENTDGMYGHNTLTGNLTHVPATNVLLEKLWHLDGQVVAYDPSGVPTDGGPGKVSGNGEPPIGVPPSLP